MGDCGTDTNSVVDAETGMMQVVYRAWYWYFFFGLFYFNMFGRIVCKDNFGECDVDPTGLSQGWFLNADTPNYIIPMTDFDNYTTVWACVPWIFGRFEWLWIMSRHRDFMERPEFATVETQVQELLPWYDVKELQTPVYQGETCTYDPVPEGAPQPESFM